MYPVITVVHIVACLFLIGVVLLQQGKGADMGAVFGGSSQTLFGSGGAGNFLTRLTTAMAVVFMATSLTLAYGSARRVTTTIFDDAPLPATESAPADAPAAGEAPPPAAPDAAAEPAPQAESAPPADAAPQPEVAPQPDAAPQADAVPQAAAPDAAGIAVVEGAQDAAVAVGEATGDAQAAAEKAAEATADAAAQAAAGAEQAVDAAAEKPAEAAPAAQQ